MRGPYWPLNTTLFVRDFRGNDPRWIHYLLKSIDFTAFNSGSVQPSLNRNYVAGIQLKVPPLPEQRGIAATLGALDDRIESNNRIVELSEALGSAILEAQLQLDPYGFPTYDQERRLGDVLAVLETGSRPKGGASANGTVSLGAENIQSAGVHSVRQLKYVPDDYAARMKRGRIEDGDILIYKDGGKPGNFVPHVSAFGCGFPVDEAVLNEHAYRARASGPIGQGLLYWLLRSYWMDQEMRKRGTGVAIPGLNSTNVRDLPLPALLDDDLATQLSETLEPLLSAMLQRGAENRRLTALRDALLPELLSGNVRAEAVVAAEAVA